MILSEQIGPPRRLLIISTLQEMHNGKAAESMEPLVVNGLEGPDEENLKQFRITFDDLVHKGASSDKAWTELQTLLYPDHQGLPGA